MFDFGNVLGIFDTSRWYEFIYQKRGNCLGPHELFSGTLLGITKDYDLGNISTSKYYETIRLAYRMSILTSKDFFDMFAAILRIDIEMLKVIKDL